MMRHSHSHGNCFRSDAPIISPIESAPSGGAAWSPQLSVHRGTVREVTIHWNRVAPARESPG